MALLRAAALGSLLAAGLAAQTPRASQAQVEAVFLFNFAQFVEWPGSAFPDSSAPLVIGVLGDDPFGPFLDETVRGETAGGRPLVVRRFRTVADVTTCHILFISPSEDRRLVAILGGLKNRPILTVSDGEAFARRGGMVRFVSEKNRVKVRINLQAAEAANLSISSKLLRAVDIVSPGR